MRLKSAMTSSDNDKKDIYLQQKTLRSAERTMMMMAMLMIKLRVVSMPTLKDKREGRVLTQQMKTRLQQVLRGENRLVHTM
jgi:hypothetical protein